MMKAKNKLGLITFVVGCIISILTKTLGNLIAGLSGFQITLLQILFWIGVLLIALGLYRIKK